jgi:DNA recombination protein RmuC
MTFTTGLLLGIIAGAAVGLFVARFLRRESDPETIAAQLRETFSALSSQALKENSQHLLQLAESKLQAHVKLGEKELDGKKGLIDKTLKDMREDMLKVESLMKELEKDREKKFGALDQRLETAAKVIGDLNTTATGLRNALSGSKNRGQWGERMAEDVLRLAGFIEGINYTKQTKMETEASRPDFTFLLPQELKLNMDVKFPFDNYELFVNAQTDGEKEKHKNAFLKDVRARIRELNGRSYINPEENTVDYVLLFIPNEQIYAFINEVDRSVIDEALKAKTILCSPLTLYAVLGLVRQAVDNFSLERKSADMLKQFGAFKKQWDEFKAAMQDFGKKLTTAHTYFESELAGTRMRQVERPLLKLEAIRAERGLDADATIAIETEEIVETVSKKNIQRTLLETAASES